MKIQVLGSGCQNCKKLSEITAKALNELNLNEEVEYITGDAAMNKIIELGAMSAPVLAINGKVVMAGLNPDLNLIKKLIKSEI